MSDEQEEGGGLPSGMPPRAPGEPEEVFDEKDDLTAKLLQAYRDGLEALRIPDTPILRKRYFWTAEPIKPWDGYPDLGGDGGLIAPEGIRGGSIRPGDTHSLEGHYTPPSRRRWLDWPLPTTDSGDKPTDPPTSD